MGILIKNSQNPNAFFFNPSPDMFALIFQDRWRHILLATKSCFNGTRTTIYCGMKLGNHCIVLDGNTNDLYRHKWLFC